MTRAVTGAVTVLLLLCWPATLRGQARVADRAFDIAEGLRWSAAFADFATTQQFVPVGRCVESAPGLGHAPSAARVYGVGIAADAGISVFSYLIRRHLAHNERADRWAALLFIEGSAGAVHAYLAARNGRCL